MRSFTSRVNSSQAARIQLPNNLPSASSSTAAATPTLAPHPSLPETAPALDLVGGPWAVIESDPGWPYISFVIGGFRTGTFCVFTTLMHRIGVKRCQAQEVYSVEPDGLSHLGHIHAFLFCSTYSGLHSTTAASSVDSGPESKVWFANQLVTDACATQAILNVLLNCPEVDIGERLCRFRDFTQGMSPVMKGLAVSNDPELRELHNSMARPADIRDAIATAISNTPITEAEKKRAAAATKKAKASKAKPKTKPSKASKSKGKKKEVEAEAEADEFHFTGYVPSGGKVWELDGLRSTPIEVGDVPPNGSWLDVVRPAIRMKMRQIQNHGDEIRFNLMAIVEGMWEKRSDEFEMLRREKTILERRLETECPGWSSRPEILTALEDAAIFHDLSGVHDTFNPAFGSDKMEMTMAILKLPAEQLLDRWLRVVRDGQRVKGLLQEETETAQRWRSENIKRTFDYEPFIREFITALSEEKLLNPLLGLEEPDSDADGFQEDSMTSPQGKRVRMKRETE